MEYVGLFGALLFVIGIGGIVFGWLYMLFDMARERDWWYFFPTLFAGFVVGGLVLVAIAASVIKHTS